MKIMNEVADMGPDVGMNSASFPCYPDMAWKRIRSWELIPAIKTNAPSEMLCQKTSALTGYVTYSGQTKYGVSNVEESVMLTDCITLVFELLADKQMVISFKLTTRTPPT